MICLDTNIVISMLNDEASPALLRVSDAMRVNRPVAVSSVVLFELYFGAAKSTHSERNARRISEFAASTIQVLPFDSEDAMEAGDIRAALRRKGTPIGPYDVLIAAQARRRDALLVTANMREFRRVPGLNVEDWSERI